MRKEYTSKYNDAFQKLCSMEELIITSIKPKLKLAMKKACLEQGKVADWWLDELAEVDAPIVNAYLLQYGFQFVGGNTHAEAIAGASLVFCQGHLQEAEEFMEKIEEEVLKYPKEAEAYCRGLVMLVGHFSEVAILSAVKTTLGYDN